MNTLVNDTNFLKFNSHNLLGKELPVLLPDGIYIISQPAA